MKREVAVQQIESQGRWDVIVIGGGATGLGAAVDAAARGYKTVLLEQSDFAKGTSSRSTKLVHGGVRYLRQGNVALGKVRLLSRSQALAEVSNLAPEGLCGGVLYYDGHARERTVARTAGAPPRN